MSQTNIPNSPAEAMIAAALDANAVLRDWFHRMAVTADRDTAMGTKIKHTHYGHYGYEDVCTQADLDSETAILPRLRACLDIPVVAEESAPHCAPLPDGARRWLVDPLDGTSCFKKGQSNFSVTIALQTKQNGAWKTDIGLVAAPMENKIYLADHEAACVILGGTQTPLKHMPAEPAASGTEEALRDKKIEVVSYSRANQAIIQMRVKLFDGPYKSQASFSSALVMAKMAEPEGVDGVILGANALDYDWDIHAARHIAETSGILARDLAIDGEPVVLLAKNRSVLNALETRFTQTYFETKAALLLPEKTS